MRTAIIVTNMDVQEKKDRVCNAEGRRLIEFCENNAFEVVKGKYG
jgi:hypothetical protein